MRLFAKSGGEPGEGSGVSAAFFDVVVVLAARLGARLLARRANLLVSRSRTRRENAPPPRARSARRRDDHRAPRRRRARARSLGEVDGPQALTTESDYYTGRKCAPRTGGW